LKGQDLGGAAGCLPVQIIHLIAISKRRRGLDAG
jgi:hypothetical protein